jgi:Xaa-Pro aminopeptidase
MSLSPEVYADRRRRFMEGMESGAAALFPAAPVAIRSNDVEYAYRQDSDLLYLTGFAEPEAACLLLPGHATAEYVLFVQPRDPERETWTGKRAGVDGARVAFAAQASHPIGELEEKIGDYLAGRDCLYYAFGRNLAFNERVLRWAARWREWRPRSGQGPRAIRDSSEIVHEMRLLKSDEEIGEMRHAIGIAAEAHRAAMRAVVDGVHEFEIEALLDGTFRRLGASGPAYPSIVASGANATVLHYTTNDRQMRAGELVLIDAGAEYDGYAADITRTYAVAPDFSAAQRAVYDIVLVAQLAAIEAVRPGAPIDAPHRRAVEVLVDGLRDLKLLHAEREEIISQELYRPFYMHRTSHWLGMDVHDVGTYVAGGEPRELEPGMVMTVEPGLYIPARLANTHPEFAGVGVRIEDDVLVTENGSEVLSAGIPKAPDDIAAWRHG